ncbi:50S ribosomal protein L23 [Mycoplasmatota bacterium]|nr:50S ribosomal protein L23 [Mycoplasmatota bacterium]
MRDPKDIIKRPIITEKTSDLMAKDNKYTFAVDKKANKTEVKYAIEELFNVKVDKVNVANVRPKRRRVGKYEGLKPGYKKAIVKLVAGNSIELFEV